MSDANRALTLAEKIIARAAGRTGVTPGDIVTCRVDLAMLHDSSGPRRLDPLLKKLGSGVWDPGRVVLISDHYVPAVDPQSAAILKLTRDWAVTQKIDSFYDQQGICHVVLPERGHLRPGMFVVGGDSHSPTGGAFGCFMFGVGATDMAGVLVTGETWIRVPGTIAINWAGRLDDGVTAKDMALAMCARLGMDGGGYQAIQYSGPAVQDLDVLGRMTLCNMAAELGGQVGLIEPDESTAGYISEAGGDPPEHDFHAASLAPQVAAPHSPANAAAVDDVTPTRLDQCYIGACTGAKLDDLRMAARVLAGRQVASGLRLFVAPASTRTTAAAAADGTLAALTGAGAILLPSGCGACAGFGAGQLAEDEICLSSTSRNFKGRMGAGTSQVYLASPYTVAASAVTGHICDPRELLAEGVNG
jgi:3-isopropylmalate/(R)-2-methylmalate dehydratase large subunit